MVLLPILLRVSHWPQRTGVQAKVIGTYPSCLSGMMCHSYFCTVHTLDRFSLPLHSPWNVGVPLYFPDASHRHTPPGSREGGFIERKLVREEAFEHTAPSAPSSPHRCSGYGHWASTPAGREIESATPLIFIRLKGGEIYEHVICHRRSLLNRPWRC